MQKKLKNSWEVYVENGRQPTGLQVLDWINEVQQLGAGEILLISVDNDGLCKGPDYELLSYIEQYSKIPLIYGGGISCAEDVLKVLNSPRVDAIALSHILHFNKEKIKNIKKYLNLNKLDIRV